jgi:hypothetical protein
LTWCRGSGGSGGSDRGRVSRACVRRSGARAAIKGCCLIRFSGPDRRWRAIHFVFFARRFRERAGWVASGDLSFVLLLLLLPRQQERREHDLGKARAEVLDCHPAFHFLFPSGRAAVTVRMPSRRVGNSRTFNGILRYTVAPSSYFFTADTDHRCIASLRSCAA